MTVQSFAFAPEHIVVTVGDTVSWTNRDGAAHTSTAASRLWERALPPGQSAAVTFNEPGEFPYFCVLHSFMTGTVTVVAAGASAMASAAPPANVAPSGYLITVGGDPPTPFPRVMIGSTGERSNEGLVVAGILVACALAGALGAARLRRAAR